MCLCQCVLSAGSVFMDVCVSVCGDVPLVGACIDGWDISVCVYVCVSGGQQFLSTP